VYLCLINLLFQAIARIDLFTGILFFQNGELKFESSENIMIFNSYWLNIFFCFALI